MSEEAALLAGVLDQPDDDLPRLVYADWLEEHGGELEQARALFIRTQITLAALDPDDESWPELDALERRLRKRHERAWLGPLREHLNAWQFARGFIEHLALDAARFLARCDSLFRSLPVRGVSLHNARDRKVLVALANRPSLTQLRDLDLSGNHMAAETLRGLLESPYLGGLTALRFNDNPLGYDAVRCVVEAPELAGLTRLELRRNNFTDDTAMVLADSPYLVGLTALDLRGNAIGEGARQRLRALFSAAEVRF